MFKFIRIAVKDVYRKAFKTIIFSLIIATSISALVITLSMNISINKNIEENIINSLSSRELYIEVRNPSWKSYEEYLTSLKAVSHIEKVYKYTQKVMAKIDDGSILSRGGYMISSISQKYFSETTSGRNHNFNICTKFYYKPNYTCTNTAFISYFHFLVT